VQNVLTVNNLSKNFGDFTAVKSVSLEIAPGEILGLLGPNGAGKTTTIQMLLGVMTPSAGVIEYFGQDLKQHRSQIMERVNFSSTYINLPWDMTVEQLLTYTAYFYSITDRRKRVEEIIAIFKLQELRKKLVKNLSAGQETRLHLAKSFINNPEIVLLDEPTASLDPDIASYLRQFILSRRDKTGMSALFTSHNMAEVTEVCDRVVFLRKGQIIANDTPKNLAKDIKHSVVELRFAGNKDEVEKYLRDGTEQYTESNGRYFFQVKEEDIAAFLNRIRERGLQFVEINIEKPSLEDYFLQVATEDESQ
jgi:ABC-2 type transport system ATP-binding protein